MSKLYPIGTRLVYTEKFKRNLLANQWEYSDVCMDVYHQPFVTVKSHWNVSTTNSNLGLMIFEETGGKWGGHSFQPAPIQSILPEELFTL